jgi:predicted NBD/HSP70 family sugar kinase
VERLASHGRLHYADPMPPDGIAFRPAERLTLMALARAGAAQTRNELVEATGLPRTTILAACKSLAARGLLSEASDARGELGRPATRLSVTGGGHVAVLTLGLDRTTLQIVAPSGTILRTSRLELDRRTDFDVMIAQLMAATRAEGHPQASALVLNAPSAFVPGRGFSGGLARPPAIRGAMQVLAPSADWMSIDPTSMIQSALGIPVKVEKTANLAALGESLYGSAIGAAAVVYLDVKDGVGAGLVIRGRLFRGGGGLAGEIAHIPIEPAGKFCFCGNRGCLITEFRGPRLGNQVPEFYSPDSTRTEEFLQSGEPAAVRALTVHGARIGRAIAGFASIFNPDAVVLDGRLGAAGPPILRGVSESLELLTQPSVSGSIAFSLGTLGDSAVALGGAALAHRAWLARALGPAAPDQQP